MADNDIIIETSARRPDGTVIPAQENPILSADFSKAEERILGGWGFVIKEAIRLGAFDNFVQWQSPKKKK